MDKQKKTQCSNLLFLPNDVIEYIFSYLTIIDKIKEKTICGIHDAYHMKAGHIILRVNKKCYITMKKVFCNNICKVCSEDIYI